MKNILKKFYYFAVGGVGWRRTAKSAIIVIILCDLILTYLAINSNDLHEKLVLIWLVLIPTMMFYRVLKFFADN